VVIPEDVAEPVLLSAILHGMKEIHNMHAERITGVKIPLHSGDFMNWTFYFS